MQSAPIVFRFEPMFSDKTANKGSDEKMGQPEQAAPNLSQSEGNVENITSPLCQIAESQIRK
jgi:hypothetical protein